MISPISLPGQRVQFASRRRTPQDLSTQYKVAAHWAQQGGQAMQQEAEISHSRGNYGRATGLNAEAAGLIEAGQHHQATADRLDAQTAAEAEAASEQ